MKRNIAILFVAFFFAACLNSKPKGDNKTETAFSDTSKLIKFPKSSGWINDFENDFTPEQIEELESITSAFEKKTTNQIVIVTIESIEPYKDLKNYSLDLFNTWGIGRKDSDNGLMIIFSAELRQVSITTGLGTEKILPDAVCKKVLDERVFPNFKKALYYEGVKEGLLELIRLWDK